MTQEPSEFRWLAEPGDMFTEADAVAMVGQTFTLARGETIVSQRHIIAARIVDDGRAVILTIS